MQTETYSIIFRFRLAPLESVGEGAFEAVFGFPGAGVDLPGSLNTRLIPDPPPPLPPPVPLPHIAAAVPESP